MGDMSLITRTRRFEKEFSKELENSSSHITSADDDYTFRYDGVVFFDPNDSDQTENIENVSTCLRLNPILVEDRFAQAGLL